MPRTAVLVSTLIKPDLAASIASGEAPRRDYFELRDMLGAELLSPPAQPGRLYKVARKVGGHALAMSLLAWQKRDSYTTILTDQETVGLALAMLFKLTRTRRAHVMITHYLTPFKKQIFFRWFRAQTHVDRTVCYSTAQEKLARERLGLRPDQVALVLHPADSEFWRPAASHEESEHDSDMLRAAGLDIPDGAPLVCSAGREFRDYGTLIEAARTLPEGTHVAIATASPWSKRKDTTQQVDLPANVHVLALKPVVLRALYRRASVVAVPLFDVDFQAGSLVAYEAMACGKPVVMTKTRGQNDIISEDETGRYVPVGDAAALSSALDGLLNDPALVGRMGAEARRVVAEGGLNLDTYLQHITELVRDAERAQGSRTVTPRMAELDRQA